MVVLIVLAVIAGITAIALRGFYYVGNDDDLITLWAGQTLGRDWWFINYNGERSEMSSSILAALIAKLSHVLLPDAVYMFNKLLLFLFLPASLWLCWRCRHAYLPAPYAAVGAIATIIVGGLSPSVMYASLTGLETPVQGFLLTACGFVLAGYVMQPDIRRARRLIVLQCLLVLVRPEGFWAIGAVAMTLCLIFGAGVLRQHRFVWLLPLIFFLCLLTVRWLATGLPFPNPYYAKVMLTPDAAQWGLRSLTRFYMMTPVRLVFGGSFLVASLYMMWRLWKRLLNGYDRAMLALLAMIAGQNLFFILTCGGTVVWLNRFMAPVLLLEAALLWHMLMRLSAYKPRLLLLVSAVILVALAVEQAAAIKPRARFTKMTPEKIWHHIQHSSIKRLNWDVIQWNRAHIRDNKSVHGCIKHKLAKPLRRMGQMRVLTYQAGFFPYYLKKRYPKADIRFFDTKGLIQPDAGLIARKKDSKGAAGGVVFIPLLTQESEIFNKVQLFNPNVIYALDLTEGDLRLLPTLGWRRLCFVGASEVWIKIKK
jgi:hypothetical protein